MEDLHRHPSLLPQRGCWKGSRCWGCSRGEVGPTLQGRKHPGHRLFEPKRILKGAWPSSAKGVQSDPLSDPLDPFKCVLGLLFFVVSLATWLLTVSFSPWFPPIASYFVHRTELLKDLWSNFYVILNWFGGKNPLLCLLCSQELGKWGSEADFSTKNKKERKILEHL